MPPKQSMLGAVSLKKETELLSSSDMNAQLMQLNDVLFRDAHAGRDGTVNTSVDTLRLAEARVKAVISDR